MADDELPSIFGSISALKAVTPASEGPQPGEVRADAELVERLSTGLLGYCFRGQLRSEEVAVHVLGARVTQEAKGTFEQRLDAFVSALRGKSPANVAKPVSLAADRTAFTTRLCTGGSLADERSWELGQKLVVFATVAEAVEHLHDAGITHGALSPAAVLLDEDGTPWIAGASGTNLLLGTSGDSADPNAFHTYASPEAKVGDQIDPRSDVFSLGRVLYFLLCGRHRLLAGEDLLPLEELKDSPEGLVRIVRKCTRLDPADRYQTVKQLLTDLVRYHQHDSVGVAHPDVSGKLVDEASVEPLLIDFDPRKTERVPPVILDDPQSAPALDALERADSSAASSNPAAQKKQRTKAKGRKGTTSSEIAVAAGASLVLLGIFASFLGGDNGMVIGPVIALVGAGVVAMGLARRLR